MLHSLVEWLQNLIETIGPVGVGIATFVESLFTPIPSEVILVTAGTIINTPLDLVLYVICATLGSYFGTLPFYFVASKSRAALMRFIDKWGVFLLIQRKEIEWAEDLFARRGKSLVFTGRLIPTVRSLISIPAGLINMNFTTYTIYTLAGSSLWNLLLIGLGYMLKDSYQSIINYFSAYEKVIIGIIILCVLWYLFMVAKEARAILKERRK